MITRLVRFIPSGLSETKLAVNNKDAISCVQSSFELRDAHSRVNIAKGGKPRRNKTPARAGCPERRVGEFIISPV